MIRRNFLKGVAATGAVAAAASSYPAPAIAQGIRELRMVTTWPKNFPGLGTAAEDLSKRVRAISNGKLQIKVFAAGELVLPMQSFDAVSEGTVDMSHSASYYWQDKHKSLNFFTAVPFGLTGLEHASWIYTGGGQGLWDEVCAQFNVKPLLRASTGVQMGGWYRREINTLKDFKGLKFRMPGLGGEVLRRLGVTVIDLPRGDIFPALQSGAIDGTEWVGPWNDLAFGFYKVAKYYYWPGFHEPGTTGEVLFNKKVWDNFSKADQAMLAAAIQAQAWKEYCDFNFFNADSLPVLLNKHKVRLRKYNDGLLMALGKVAGQVVAEIGNSDPLTKKIYDSYIAFRRKMIGWSKLGEQGYLNARSLPFKYS